MIRSLYIKLRKILGLIVTPLGRHRLYRRFLRLLWPILRFVAILYRKIFLRHTRVVVVIGSFGKTTTVRAVSAALGTRRIPHGSGNAFEEIVEAMLRIRPSDRRAVFEVGVDAPGQMAAYVNMLRPDITVVTSIGSEHNRSFGTLEATREEKATTPGPNSVFDPF